jgi:ArsR family transcriptional regulator, cadmium/lead-responsive transcriptional repressor
MRDAPAGSGAELVYIAIPCYHRQMAIMEDAFDEATGIQAAELLFHSLSDATRLAIVRRLAEGEARVADLVEQLGLAQSTVSKHVACLRDCHLVDGRPAGRQVFYSLARPELMDLLAAAETLLEATGNAVVLCPNYDMDSPSAQRTPRP